VTSEHDVVSFQSLFLQNFFKGKGQTQNRRINQPLHSVI